jgi:hypothetical protein
MRQITVRLSDPELEERIRRMAKESGKSLNKVVLDLLNGETGKERKKQAGESLARLAGGWSDQDAREFEEAVEIFERIDEEIWK